MIVAIGTDLVEVDRIRQAAEGHGGFLDRVFTEQEQKDCRAGGHLWQSLAGRFAAKEAFLKVCGQGIFALDLRDIEVVRLSSGAPGYRLHNRAEELARELGIGRVHLSISHEKNLAMAMAVGEDTRENR